MNQLDGFHKREIQWIRGKKVTLTQKVKNAGVDVILDFYSLFFHDTMTKKERDMVISILSSCFIGTFAWIIFWNSDIWLVITLVLLWWRTPLKYIKIKTRRKVRTALIHPTKRSISEIKKFIS